MVYEVVDEFVLLDGVREEVTVVLVAPDDVEDLVELHLHEFVIRLHEDRPFRLGLFRGGWFISVSGHLEPTQCLVGGLQEIIVADGFQQIVQGIHLESVQGILLESGGEDHLCLVTDVISDYFSWLEDYIEKLEDKVENLEKNVKVEKKVMYRVEVIYEHDLDTEHRQVYFGPDVKRARKEFMDYFNFFDTTGDELYYFPMEEVMGSREEQRKYTGLELQQKFLDMFNQHIRENKSIDFSCDCDNFATEYGQDVGDGLVGCKVDILEV